MQRARNEGQILTGLLYMNPESKDLHTTINSSPKPLNSLKEKDLTPIQGVLAKLNAGFR
jgi:2-oxoglutarate ferredoxin oxidoreductase subunit beta